MWRRVTAKEAPAPAAKPSGDPFAPHAAKHLAYLEQARWLLEQQHRRSATFQQTAVALVGFDGVLLALLLSNDTLSTFVRYDLPWWAGTLSSVLLAASALAAVLALVPAGTHSVSAARTIEGWAEHLAKGGWDDSTQFFAQMLLIKNPPEDGADSRAARFGSWWRSRLGKKPLSKQPIRSAERLATRRGWLTTTSAFLLFGGIIGLLVVLVASPAAARGEDPATGARDPVSTSQSTR